MAARRHSSHGSTLRAAIMPPISPRPTCSPTVVRRCGSSSRPRHVGPAGARRRCPTSAGRHRLQPDPSEGLGRRSPTARRRGALPPPADHLRRGVSRRAVGSTSRRASIAARNGWSSNPMTSPCGREYGSLPATVTAEVTAALAGWVDDGTLLPAFAGTVHLRENHLQLLCMSAGVKAPCTSWTTSSRTPRATRCRSVE